MIQISIIVPCYNEASRFPSEMFADFLSQNRDYHFIFANDGSTDGTLALLQQLSARYPANVEVFDFEKNGGKAETIRRAALQLTAQTSADYIGFLDADLATPLSELSSFRAACEKEEFDIVMGLRLMRLGAQVKRKPARHFIGRIFATVASQMLRLPVYDTQCGAKFFRAYLLPDLFHERFCTRWLFDVELLARYIKTNGRQKALTQICEYPLFAWDDVGGSKLKYKDFLKAPFELLKIYRKYRKYLSKTYVHESSSTR